MITAAAIRVAYPRDTVKRLAQAVDVPVATARSWLYREISDCRREQIARALTTELRRQATEIERLLETLEGELGGALAGSKTSGIGSGEVADAIERPADPVGGAVK